MNEVGCLVLAAGYHKRFGAPKLLHALSDGKTVIEHTLTNINETGLTCAVVCRRNDTDLISVVQEMGCALVEAPESNSGIGHSLALGIKATGHWSGWVITLADMPMVKPVTYLSIANVLSQNHIVIPVFENKKGNPRGFSRHFYQQLTELDGDSGARSLIGQYPELVKYVETNDKGILFDVDTPADLRGVSL